MNVSSAFQQQVSAADNKSQMNPFDDQPMTLVDLQNQNIEEDENPFAEDTPSQSLDLKPAHSLRTL